MLARVKNNKKHYSRDSTTEEQNVKKIYWTTKLEENATQKLREQFSKGIQIGNNVWDKLLIMQIYEIIYTQNIWEITLSIWFFVSIFT